MLKRIFDCIKGPKTFQAKCPSILGEGGGHIPAKAVDKHGETMYVICQNCTIEMTEAQHREYFEQFYQTKDGELWLKGREENFAKKVAAVEEYEFDHDFTTGANDVSGSISNIGAVDLK